MTLIENPSQLPQAISEALRRAFPELKVGTHQDFQGGANNTGVLITVEGDGPGIRSREGRKAHALGISLKAMVAPGAWPFDACDLASQLMDLVLDNRWNLPQAQCDLPTSIVAAPSISTSAETDYDTWTLTFTQTLFIGPPLLNDPTGQPLFACTWDVSNIDDPDQYKPSQKNRFRFGIKEEPWHLDSHRRWKFTGPMPRCSTSDYWSGNTPMPQASSPTSSS